MDQLLDQLLIVELLDINHHYGLISRSGVLSNLKNLDPYWSIWKIS